MFTRRQSRRAFTLVETMVAMTLLALVIVPIFALFALSDFAAREQKINGRLMGVVEYHQNYLQVAMKEFSDGMKGVPLLPANVNIAAVLSLAGVGFDRTRLKVVADPALTHNTHYITMRGDTGKISIKLENVPSPDNPKTAWLACYSALAALKCAKSPVRYGT